MKLFTSIIATVFLIGSAVAQRTFELTASITPKAPIAGENRLEVVFSESGKPVTGLRLTSSVGMTNMDMGTAHPVVKEITPGHYMLRPMLLMGGPWQVTLVSVDPKFTAKLDMTAGGKGTWNFVKQTISVGDPSKDVPTTQKADPVKTDPRKTDPPKTDSIKQEPAKSEAKKAETQMQGDPMSGTGMSGMGHTTASVPQLKEKASYAWTEAMDFDTRTGFGKVEPMVRMMILMMVGGSGMEGMKMAPMDMKFGESNFTESVDEPMKNMADMNMGNKALKVEAKLDKAGVGDNNVTVTITTPDGKPVEKAKVTTAVAMTSMDMGTTHPAVKEMGKGKYVLKANFSMGGPWRITLTVTAPNLKPATYSFDFDAK